jgi:hypothetical protein
MRTWYIGRMRHLYKTSVEKPYLVDVGTVVVVDLYALRQRGYYLLIEM